MFILDSLCMTNHAFDRQTDVRTDGQTAFSWLDRVASNACSAVKMKYRKAFRIGTSTH